MIGANAPAPSAPAPDPKSTEQRSHEPSMEEILASIRRIISDDQMLPLSPRASVPPLSANRWERERAARAEPAESQPEPHHAAALPDPHDTEPANAAADDAGAPARPDPHADEHQEDDVLDLAEVAHSDDRRSDDLAHETTPSGVGPATGSHEAPLAAEPRHTVPEQAAVEPATAAAAPVAAAASPMVAAALPSQGKDAEREHEPIVSDDTVSSVSSHFQQLAATMLMQNFPPVDQIARELLRPMIKTWLDDNLPVMVERLVRAEIERVARVGR